MACSRTTIVHTVPGLTSTVTVETSECPAESVTVSSNS